MTDPRWTMLENAKPALMDALAFARVIGIEVVAAFPGSDSIAIWLCTSTDEERDSLPRENPHLDEVRAVLLEAGFSPAELAELMTVAQSQETVDRDYEASWFYALR